MSTETGNATPAGLNGSKRRGRRPASSEEGQPPIRFFAGEMSKEGITLAREFASEPEAQLNALKLDQPYFSVEAWKVKPDFSNGSIAVTKQPIGKP